SLLILASVTAFGLAARSVLGSPPPLWISLSAFVAYAGLVVAGVLLPSLEMFAEVVSHGPEGAKGVALTFDDGPHPSSTPAILDELERAGGKATFFVLGEKAARYPEIISEIVRRGHALGVHGRTHDRLLSLRSLARVRDELSSVTALVTQATGHTTRLFRPPVGQTNPTIARAARDLGLTIVGWSVRGWDGVRTNPDRVVARVVPKLQDGAIVLLHDASEKDDRVPASVAALPRILAALRKRGLDAVRLDAWLDDGDARG
ncbi:MAG TPA: polysaccharide deacetylase family protein, partial [Polyangiaceae bacterium]